MLTIFRTRRASRSISASCVSRLLLGSSLAVVLLIGQATGVIAAEAPKPAASPPVLNYAPAPTVIEYDVDPKWPQRPEHLAAWGDMTGVAVDVSDNVWLFNKSDDPVQVYTADGRFVRTWGKGIFHSPHFLRIDHEGNVWTADYGWHVVRKFTPEGELLLTLGTLKEPGRDATHFNRPTDMAITRSGDIFVTDGYGNRRIVHFDKEGKFVKEWGGFGAEPGQFVLPHAIVADAQGVLYVCDRNSGRIQLFNQDGTLRSVWSDLIMPWGITLTREGDLWICGSTPHQWIRSGIGKEFRDQVLTRLSTDGRVRQLWSLPLGKSKETLKGDETIGVHGIAQDSKGNLYVGDAYGQHALKLMPVRK
jgi:streptogramin lyase